MFPQALLPPLSGAQPSHILPNSPSIDKAKWLQETRLPQRTSAGGPKPAEQYKLARRKRDLEKIFLIR